MTIKRNRYEEILAGGMPGFFQSKVDSRAEPLDEIMGKVQDANVFTSIGILYDTLLVLLLGDKVINYDEYKSEIDTINVLILDGANYRQIISQIELILAKYID